MVKINLPHELFMFVQDSKWTCYCGTQSLRFYVMRNGKISSHCPQCGITMYWNDDNKLLSGDVLCRHDSNYVTDKETKKQGWRTRWCTLCRIREFYQPPHGRAALGIRSEVPITPQLAREPQIPERRLPQIPQRRN